MLARKYDTDHIFCSPIIFFCFGSPAFQIFTLMREVKVINMLCFVLLAVTGKMYHDITTLKMVLLVKAAIVIRQEGNEVTRDLLVTPTAMIDKNQ